MRSAGAPTPSAGVSPALTPEDTSVLLGRRGFVFCFRGNKRGSFLHLLFLDINSN